MSLLKERKGTLIGTIYTIGSSQVAEIISLSGFDWVMIDMEHSTLSLDSLQNTLQVLGADIIKIVRIPGNDDIWIKRVLDTGCDGILVPMVRTAEEASRVILSAKYPIEGQRSVGLTRAHKYGLDFTGYITRANKDLVIIIQVEHIEGVKNIDSILKVKGIDSIFIGPYDLSASMGFIGQPDHAEVLDAISLVKRKCTEAGIPYGIFGADPQALENEYSDGCRYILCGIDTALITNAYTEMIHNLRKRINKPAH